MGFNLDIFFFRVSDLMTQAHGRQNLPTYLTAHNLYSQLN